MKLINNNNIGKAKIILATSWVFPHVGGVSSHMQLLANKLEIPVTDVISFDQIVDNMRSAMFKRGQVAAESKLKKIFNLETVSIYSKSLTKIIESSELEIVHCHDAMATWAAICARKKSKKRFKIVSTVHGPVSRHMVEEGSAPNAPNVLKVAQCEKEAWRGCDAIIAVDTTQSEILKEQGADPTKISIIPNAVDVARLDRIKDCLSIKRGDDRSWVFVPRRLTPKNGIEYAIRAMPHMRIKPLLLLAGDGVDRSRMKQLVAQLNLQNDVLFLGALEHEIMLPLMAASDVVLIPSVPVHGIVEATSIAAIEAMALCKTVVASDIGGLKELINNGENGLLIPSGDPLAIAQALNVIFADAVFMSNLGLAARQSVEDHFCSEIWYERHLRVYEQLL